MNRDGLFHFKRFSVSHTRSSMKVGVDGVLIGLWVSPEGRRILDVGTGCGIIPLILAQRISDAEILGIDIDRGSVEESRENFLNSPWRDRLVSMESAFGGITREIHGLFDMVVSNPPFYDSGIIDTKGSPRLTARHVGTLSPVSLLEHSRELLSPGGRVAMIIPSEHFRTVWEKGVSLGYVVSRGAWVRNHPEAKVKRVLAEFSLNKEEIRETGLANVDFDMLTLFTPEREPTDEYREMGREFYLKF